MTDQAGQYRYNLGTVCVDTKYGRPEASAGRAADSID